MSTLLLGRCVSRPLANHGAMTRLLRPRTLAIVGGRAGAEVIRQCRRIGFAGQLWPVHPRLDQIEGLPVYRSVSELPGAPDAAFVAVNRHTSLEVIHALAARGAGGAVCYASGFAELGVQGSELQAQLRTASDGMPFFGPNCHGFINYFDGVALWPEQQGGTRQTRGVAIVTQSGNIALNLTMQLRGLPIGYVVTLGNQAGIDLAGTIQALLDDERVTAIGLHIEGIGDATAFMHAAAIARRRGIPMVAIMTGRSDLGAELAWSHTASLAGADAVGTAFLRRAGVVRVRSISILIETLKLLALHGPLPGRDIASMSSSGGEASLVADAAGDCGLRLRPLTPTQAQRVAATLPDLATASNPLDYHNFSWGDEAALGAIYAAVMEAGYDLTLLVLDFPRRDRCSDASYQATVSAVIAATRATGARVAVVSTLAETLPEHRSQQLAQAGIAALCGLDDAMAAVAAAAESGELLRAASACTLWAMPTPSGAARSLSEWDAKRRLAACGLKVPAGQLAASVAAAVDAATEIGFPVAVKSVGAAIAHKTDIGALRLGVGDAAAVRAAAIELAPMGEALLVEQMVGDPVAELIVGIKRDPVFGWYLLLGSGGTLVNLVGDSRILTLPASRAEIMAAIRALKVGVLLAGHRGRPVGDIDAAAGAVLIIQDFAFNEQHRLLELEVNPLIVRPAGCGAVAVDALIRITEDQSHE
ncbi:MAG TPA: acetate--CoA ligase family protein [Steroidobacteraceae bacterium]|nr:acetate--CoA ligase family protein [Steroidobacteraceae bacterium]